MPESIVQVTEGSGKKLHTWQRTIGANNVEDEYVLLGENALASYVLPTIGAVSSTATANSHLLQIMAGSSNRVRVRRIEVHQYALATTAAFMDLYMFRLTTAGTGGTTHTVSPLDTSDGAAGAAVMTLPTVKGTEGALLSAARPYMMQTVGASAPMTQPIAVWDFDRLRSKPLTIAAGTTNGICIKNATAVAGGSVFFVVQFDESSF